jgi:UrcA family protein
MSAVQKVSFAAAIATLMVLATATASAAQVVGPDVLVRYADLDITTVAGAEKLYERIQQAAAQVCPAPNSPLASAHVALVRCRNEVVAHAVSSVGSPQVTAVFAARTHHGVRSPA